VIVAALVTVLRSRRPATGLAAEVAESVEI
jgi:hypothetical protein